MTSAWHSSSGSGGCNGYCIQTRRALVLADGSGDGGRRRSSGRRLLALDGASRPANNKQRARAHRRHLARSCAPARAHSAMSTEQCRRLPPPVCLRQQLFVNARATWMRGDKLWRQNFDGQTSTCERATKKQLLLVSAACQRAGGESNCTRCRRKKKGRQARSTTRKVARPPNNKKMENWERALSGRARRGERRSCCTRARSRARSHTQPNAQSARVCVQPRQQNARRCGGDSGGCGALALARTRARHAKCAMKSAQIWPS